MAYTRCAAGPALRHAAGEAEGGNSHAAYCTPGCRGLHTPQQAGDNGGSGRGPYKARGSAHVQTMHRAFGLLALCALVTPGGSAPVNTTGVQQTPPAPSPAHTAPWTSSGSGSDDGGDFWQAFFYPNSGGGGRPNDATNLPNPMYLQRSYKTERDN